MITLHRVSESAEPEMLTMARVLMAEYAAMPHTALRWPRATADIAALPYPFQPPHGVLLVATDGAVPVGCGALASFDALAIAEIKRVYVRPAARGRRIGDTIMHALLAEAATLGYSRVRLDTAPELFAAQALYLRLGFTQIPQYRAGMLPGDPCFEFRLRDDR
jgi:putative acetyltransferase